MKKIIMLLSIAALMGSTTLAQKLSEDKVPAEVISAFKAKFPNAAKIYWKMETINEYEATFKVNGEELSANFDNTGKWIETETEIKASALPVAIQSALKKDFEGFKIGESSKVENATEGNCFEIEIKKGEERYEVLYSPEGKMLKKAKIEKGHNH